MGKKNLNEILNDSTIIPTLCAFLQLDDQQRSTLVSIFYSAREKNSFFAAVDAALKCF